MEHGKYVSIPAKVGCMSLIGVRTDSYPVEWGNYFSFAGENFPRCVNMWEENLEEAKKRFLPDGMIRGWLFTEQHKSGGMLSWFVVCDDRISVEWLYNKFCFTGYYSPSKAVAAEMYSVYNDFFEELEQFTNPDSYYKKKGYDVICHEDGTKILRKNVEVKPRALKFDWKIEQAVDVGFVHSTNVVKQIT